MCQNWCYSVILAYSCLARKSRVVISRINTIVKMRIIHSVLKSPLNSPEIHEQRIKRREQREDRRQCRAHINAKKKNKMRTESRKSTAVLCYVEIKQKEKKSVNGKRCDGRMRSSCLLPDRSTEAATNDSSFSKEPLIIHEVAPITITHRLIAWWKQSRTSWNCKSSNENGSFYYLSK